MVLEDCQRKPAKPCGVGEGAYEDGPQYPTGPIDALSVRRQAYWSYFAGGYHTYGNTNTWNFGSYKPEGTGDWKAALESPGARSLGVLRKIFDSIAWWKLDPDSSLLVRRGHVGSKNPTHVALRAGDGTGALVYISVWDKFAVDMGRAATAETRTVTWIEPRTGARRSAGAVPASGEHAFAVPAGWQDALLLIDGGIGQPAATRAARRPPGRGR
jgi:hypothetical protein